MKKLTLCSPMIWANTWAPCLKQVGDDGDGGDDDDDDWGDGDGDYDEFETGTGS